MTAPVDGPASAQRCGHVINRHGERCVLKVGHAGKHDAWADWRHPTIADALVDAAVDAHVEAFKKLPYPTSTTTATEAKQRIAGPMRAALEAAMAAKEAAR